MSAKNMYYILTILVKTISDQYQNSSLYIQVGEIYFPARSFPEGIR